LYRHAGHRIEVLLVHPGGPFWAGKDVAAWSIPKGIVDEEVNTVGPPGRLVAGLSVLSLVGHAFGQCKGCDPEQWSHEQDASALPTDIGYFIDVIEQILGSFGGYGDIHSFHQAGHR
jgi:hypothetical protein